MPSEVPPLADSGLVANEVLNELHHVGRWSIGSPARDTDSLFSLARVMPKPPAIRARKDTPRGRCAVASPFFGTRTSGTFAPIVKNRADSPSVRESGHARPTAGTSSPDELGPVRQEAALNRKGLKPLPDEGAKLTNKLTRPESAIATSERPEEIGHKHDSQVLPVDRTIRSGRRIWSSLRLPFRNLKRFPGHATKRPNYGRRRTPSRVLSDPVDSCESITFDRVSETRRLRDVTFEERYLGRMPHNSPLPRWRNIKARCLPSGRRAKQRAFKWQLRRASSSHGIAGRCLPLR